MIGNSRLLARIALFSALIYVFSWGTVYLPNINLIFFIVFTAGYTWGFLPGIIVGAFGMGLWTFFNPFGPAPFPVAFVQVLGAAICGAIGFVFRRLILPDETGWLVHVKLGLAGVLCTFVYFGAVNVVDAWLFQPFRERFIAGMIFSLNALFANMIIFPLLFRLLRPFYLRESNLQ